MATPDVIALGVALTPQARTAAVMAAYRMGCTAGDVLADVDLVLATMAPADQEARRTAWRQAIVGVYGRRAVQLAMLEGEA